MNIDTKIDCVRRELKRRKKFYPKMVADGKVDQEWADIEISVMLSVLETLTQLKGMVGGVAMDTTSDRNEAAIHGPGSAC